jgi:hypothetical protein
MASLKKKLTVYVAQCLLKLNKHLTCILLLNFISVGQIGCLNLSIFCVGSVNRKAQNLPSCTRALCILINCRSKVNRHYSKKKNFENEIF